MKIMENKNYYNALITFLCCLAMAAIIVKDYKDVNRFKTIETIIEVDRKHRHEMDSLLIDCFQILIEKIKKQKNPHK